MIKRTEYLVKLIRQKTDNVNENTVINDVIASYLNDAQTRIQSLIYQKKPETNPFNVVGFIELLPDKDEYSLEFLKDINGNVFRSHMLSGQAITSVELSTETLSNTKAYFPLKLVGNKERFIGSGYFLRDNNIIVTPKITKGYLRITYPKKLPTLDFRRGKVININTLSNMITLDESEIPYGTDFKFIDYITINDFDGKILKEKIKVISYNNTFKTLVLESVDGISINNFICYGDYSTSHCKLDDCVERYIVEYSCLRIFMQDSSKDTTAQSTLVSMLEEEITGLYADNMNDVQHIPIISTDYLTL